VEVLPLAAGRGTLTLPGSSAAPSSVLFATRSARAVLSPEVDLQSGGGAGLGGGKRTREEAGA
jgi:hypothetical protein